MAECCAESFAREGRSAGEGKRKASERARGRKRQEGERERATGPEGSSNAVLVTPMSYHPPFLLARLLTRPSVCSSFPARRARPLAEKFQPRIRTHRNPEQTKRGASFFSVGPESASAHRVKTHKSVPPTRKKPRKRLVMCGQLCVEYGRVDPLCQKVWKSVADLVIYACVCPFDHVEHPSPFKDVSNPSKCLVIYAIYVSKSNMMTPVSTSQMMG